VKPTQKQHRVDVTKEVEKEVEEAMIQTGGEESGGPLVWDPRWVYKPQRRDWTHMLLPHEGARVICRELEGKLIWSRQKGVMEVEYAVDGQAKQVPLTQFENNAGSKSKNAKTGIRLIEHNLTLGQAADEFYIQGGPEWSSVGSEWIGQLVRRTFGAGPSVVGRIVSWARKGPQPDEPALWHVVYSDGDEEDLEEGEAREAVEAYNAEPLPPNLVEKKPKPKPKPKPKLPKHLPKPTPKLLPKPKPQLMPVSEAESKTMDEQNPPKSSQGAGKPEKAEVTVDMYQLSVTRWLKGLANGECTGFAEAFEEEGYDDMRFLCEATLSPEELQLLGLENTPQCTIITETLEAYKAKYCR